MLNEEEQRKLLRGTARKVSKEMYEIIEKIFNREIDFKWQDWLRIVNLYFDDEKYKEAFTEVILKAWNYYPPDHERNKNNNGCWLNDNDAFARHFLNVAMSQFALKMSRFSESVQLSAMLNPKEMPKGFRQFDEIEY